MLPANALLKDADELEDATAGRGEKLAGRLVAGCYDSLAPTVLDVPPGSHHTMSLFEAEHVRPRIQHRTTDFELTRSLAGGGLGYTLLVQRPHTDLTYEGRRVFARPISAPVKEVSVKLAWPQAVRLNNRAAALVEYVLANVSRSQLLPEE